MLSVLYGSSSVSDNLETAECALQLSLTSESVFTQAKQRVGNAAETYERVLLSSIRLGTFCRCGGTE